MTPSAFRRSIARVRTRARKMSHSSVSVSESHPHADCGAPAASVASGVAVSGLARGATRAPQASTQLSGSRCCHWLTFVSGGRCTSMYRRIASAYGDSCVAAAGFGFSATSKIPMQPSQWCLPRKSDCDYGECLDGKLEVKARSTLRLPGVYGEPLVFTRGARLTVRRGSSA